MTPVSLAEHLRMKKHYTRSANLERDLGRPDALDGYIVTSKVAALLERVGTATRIPGSPRAWTATGVYGTGKSAFAELLTALHGPVGDAAHERAIDLLTTAGLSHLAEHYAGVSSGAGFVRAVVTARREPVAHAVLRALSSGAEAFWDGRRGKRPAAVEECRARAAALAQGDAPRVDDLASLVAEVARASRQGVLLVIDELGKNLEQSARSGGADDLYLLQQLAELPNGSEDPPVLVLVTLHQAFAEYGTGLAPSLRAEWDKVQGRFEHFAFAEAPEDMLRLIADAIEADLPDPVAALLESKADAWRTLLESDPEGAYVAGVLTRERIKGVFPLHPLAALVLPTLCAKYAQNDRSLFTFLSSHEPHSLSRFLTERSATKDELPLLIVPELYDYFVDTAAGAASRPQFQRWAEVHGLIQDAGNLSSDETATLKVIGTLNLVATGGPLRARRNLVVAVLSSSPGDETETEHWASVLDGLNARRLVTYRKQVDEYRLWEGSDYDVEAAVMARVEADPRPLALLLEEVAPLAPIVAQRHSYQTGTLRYFERRYVETPEELASVSCRTSESDGLLVYWIGSSQPPIPPAKLKDGRPLALLVGTERHDLAAVAREGVALMGIERDDPAIQTDGVARREVRHRLILARSALRKALATAFASARFVEGSGRLKVRGVLGSALSDLCDHAYKRGPVLWNEIVNRRELTAQGAQARRRVLEAMLANLEQERLGIEGNGPEYSIYASVLLHTGIHRRESTGWTIGPPTEGKVGVLWETIERFCLESTAVPRGIDQLYRKLERPPYGVKHGVIPVMLAAVLLYHADDVSVYRDGTFLPVLGPEHFELLVKDPARFAVKHFALTGLRLEIFRDLEGLLRAPAGKLHARVRNSTLLGVVRPLVRFATSLPAVTRKATDMSREAIAARDILLSETEPDRLLFEKLPAALGHPPFAGTVVDQDQENQRLTEYRSTLFRTLRELDSYYARLLEHCRGVIHTAFGVRSELAHLREDLRVRSQYLVGRCIDPLLRRLTLVATGTDGSDREWLESIVMIIADRPAEGWTERDTAKFELNLSDVAARFVRLEALISEAKAAGVDGYETRRVVITQPDGRETNRLVWLDRNQRDQVEAEVQRLAAELRGLNNENLRDAIAVALMEEILSSNEPAHATPPQHNQDVNHG